ncbi:hypothetical protein ABVT39_000853 [Epinephelus coioides]
MPKREIHFRNLKSISTDALASDLQHLSSKPADLSSVTEAVDYYNQSLNTLLDLHAPLKTRQSPTCAQPHGTPTARVTALGQVVELAGPQLQDSAGLALKLGLRSSRDAKQLLDHWKKRMSGHELLMLDTFSSGETTTNSQDPFPLIQLTMDLKDCAGPHLDRCPQASLQEASGKTFYHLMRSDETAEQTDQEEMEQEQAVSQEEKVPAKKSAVTPAKESKQEKKDKEHNVNVDEVVNEVMEEDMAEDKKTGKRKIRECQGEEEEVEVEVEEDSGDEVGEECDMTPSQEAQTTTYSLKEIKKFLKDTKRKAAVQVENFFPDLKGFIVSVTRLKKMEDSFEAKEVYRLNKFVAKARVKLADLND